MSLISVMNKSDRDGPVKPRQGSAVSILRILRLYAAICYAGSGSLIGSSLPQWTEPASWRVVLVTTLGAPLFPWVPAGEALFFLLFLISEPTFAALSLGLFIISVLLMRKKNIGWWLIILALIPCTTIAAFALHAVGWIPKPMGPL